jgi:hemolysin III
VPVTGDPPVKPRLRGVIHQWTFVLSLATGSVLCLLARTGRALTAAVVFSASVTLLFGTSALYHRVSWRPAARALMRRLDHSMIFLLIAGTYTPFALLVVHGTASTALLAVAWAGAALGIAIQLVWVAAPRWAVLPLYLGLGWLALAVVPELLHRAGVAALVLLLVGGLFYTAGALAYAARRPDPRPRTFGYHEVFHACTFVAWVCHYAAVLLAMGAAASLA